MKKFYLFICLFLIHLSGNACSFSPESFCETLGDHPDRTIVSGKIIGVDDTGIDFEIIDVLKGEESKEVIRIWDGTDFDCNGLFSMAASDMGMVNDSLVLMLPLITEFENEWDILGDYRRPSPYGQTPDLRMENGEVIGRIKGEFGGPPGLPVLTNLPYDEFKDYILNDADCSSISVVSVAIEDIEMSSIIKLTNPVYNSLTVQTSTTLDKGNITLYSLNGQAILTEEINYQNTIEIETSNLQSGIYLVAVKAEGKLPEIFKVVKM